ncbi:MAG: hypothetical protein ACI814_002648 [Mariniblastus sp.]|jgi:hypothetical protein
MSRQLILADDRRKEALFETSVMHVIGNEVTVPSWGFRASTGS